MNEFMKLAKEEAIKGITNHDGGPFGAVIVKNGRVISKGHNEVLQKHNPVLHAEIVAIMQACEVLNTSDLTDCILYTSCEPCPMCLSAIIWANITNVYYACTKKDAASIGFRDDDIYEFIKGHNEMLNLQELNREDCLEVMQKYQNDGGKLY